MHLPERGTRLQNPPTRPTWRSTMVDFLAANPLLLLFLVAAIGYPLGRLRVAGLSLGVAAVLFTGLAIGAIDEKLQLPELVYQLGLVVFVYSIGLSSGPGFFASFRRRGLRDNAFALAVLVLATILAGGTALAFGLRSTFTAGVYSGALTSTPALAAVLETLGRLHPTDALRTIGADPVVGYSLAYPLGVIAPILAIALFQRLFRIDYAAEAKQHRELGANLEELTACTVLVTRELEDPAWEAIRKNGLHALVGRVKRGDQLFLATPETRLEVGDLVNVVTDEATLPKVIELLGEKSEEHLELDRRTLDFRRMFVSRHEVVGIPLKKLALQRRFGALITRVRRGDVDFLAQDDTTLELGDRIRVVAPRHRMAEVARWFGDSIRDISEIDLMTFGIGIGLGLLLGSIPVPLPGGSVFRLGIAGGPLVVGLVLGKLGRTGPVVWTMPYNANLTLRQVGLTLFLAAVGTRSGYAFFDEIVHGSGLTLLAVGAIVSTAVALFTLAVGYKLLRIPMAILIGMLAGIITQPAVLAFANDQTENELPNVGYAEVYPLATIVKLLAAQLLLTALA